MPVLDASDSTQLWNAEDQCKAVFGSNSLYCTVSWSKTLFKWLIFIIKLKKYPGQIWSATDQCSMINGNGSLLCSVIIVELIRENI